jgi:hypothetical protein
MARQSALVTLQWLPSILVGSELSSGADTDRKPFERSKLNHAEEIGSGTPGNHLPVGTGAD